MLRFIAQNSFVTKCNASFEDLFLHLELHEFKIECDLIYTLLAPLTHTPLKMITCIEAVGQLRTSGVKPQRQARGIGRKGECKPHLLLHRKRSNREKRATRRRAIKSKSKAKKSLTSSPIKAPSFALLCFHFFCENSHSYSDFGFRPRRVSEVATVSNEGKGLLGINEKIILSAVMNELLLSQSLDHYSPHFSRSLHAYSGHKALATSTMLCNITVD